MKAIPFLIILTLLFACRSSKQTTQSQQASMNQTPSAANVPATIYKTVANYDDKVPITMNPSRTSIVSYPDPTDLGDHAKPTPLPNGYLLDNRGINENTVFLKYTYDEYRALPSPPTLAEMNDSIIDKYPLTEIIRCGYRHQYPNLVEAMTKLVQSNFINCDRIRISRREPLPSTNASNQ